MKDDLAHTVVYNFSRVNMLVVDWGAHARIPIAKYLLIEYVVLASAVTRGGLEGNPTNAFVRQKENWWRIYENESRIV